MTPSPHSQPVRPKRGSPDNPATFIRENTRLLALSSVPEIRLHTAHEATGLWRLAKPGADGSEPPPPYWAFPWAGGMALARYILDRPESVAGRRVLDLGSGSGLVAIAAARSSATAVTAADIDPYAIAAISLNAAANDVVLDIVATDLTAGPPPAVDLVTVGDLFYEKALAERVTPFLDRCLAAGIAVIIGDPRRAYLPYGRLQLLAEYPVPDVGEVESAVRSPAAVFAFR